MSSSIAVTGADALVVVGGGRGDGGEAADVGSRTSLARGVEQGDPTDCLLRVPIAASTASTPAVLPQSTIPVPSDCGYHLHAWRVEFNDPRFGNKTVCITAEPVPPLLDPQRYHAAVPPMRAVAEADAAD